MNMLPSAQEIARILGGTIGPDGQIIAPGPGHSSKDRSMSVWLDASLPDGFVCHSFATDNDLDCKKYVCERLGLTQQKANGGGGWTFVAEYIYRDADGQPYHRVRRMLDAKGRRQFPQQRWDGRAWINEQPEKKLPYRLPELIAASSTSAVYIVEGEKCADALAKASFVATSAPGGCKARWPEELTPYFKERDVVILPDADQGGRQHAQKVAKALAGTAKSIKVVELYPDCHDGEDVADWLQTDKAATQFVKTVKSAPEWQPLGKDETAKAKGKERDDRLIDELAALSPIEYERRRKDAAEKLGMPRVSVLDELVEARRARGGKKDDVAPPLYSHWNVTPCDEAVDGHILLGALTDAIKRYVFLSHDQAVTVALWIILSWLHEYDFVTHSPILFATSAEADSGKTTLLNVIAFLARNGLVSVEISGPALFRSIDKWTPCLIVDEADDVFKENYDLRSVINSGWTRGTGVIRCHPDTHEPELYSTFSPKVLGMKGRKLPGTTLSRCLIIMMKPRLAGEHISDFDLCDNENFARLRSQILRFVIDNADKLKDAKPEVPPGFHNRRRANWLTMLAVAELCGRKTEAWTAAKAIEAVRKTFDPSIGVQLLAEIKAMFDARKVDRDGDIRLRSTDLVIELNSDQTGPWISYRKGKPITEGGVARLLRSFEVRPRTVYLGTEPDGTKITAKGYQRSWFDDVFARHLESTSPAVNPSPDNEISELDENLAVNQETELTAENPSNPLKNNEGDGLTATNPDSGGLGEDIDRTCQQCAGEPDETSREYVTAEGDRIWLHELCARFFFKAAE